MSMEQTTTSSSSESIPFSVWCCAALIFIVIGRIQEIFVFLQLAKPGMLAFALTLLTSYNSGRITDDRVIATSESKLLGFFWLFSFCTIIFSVWPGGAFHIWRASITTNYLFFLCCLMNMKTEKEILFLSRALIASVVVLSAKLLLSPEISAGMRYFATDTYDANDLAMVIVMVLPLSMAFLLSGYPRAKLNYTMILLILLAALLKTGSRGGFLGFGIISLYFLVSSVWSAGFAKRFLLAFIAVVFILYSAPDTLWQRFYDLYSGKDYNFLSSQAGEGVGRLELWKAGLNMFHQHLLTGVGPGQFSTGLGKNLGREFWVTAHNTYLQVGGDLGIIGLIVFLKIIWTIKTNFQTAKNKLLSTKADGMISSLPGFGIIALSGYVICSLFLSQAYSAFVPFFLAYSRALIRLSEKSELTLG